MEKRGGIQSRSRGTSPSNTVRWGEDHRQRVGLGGNEAGRREREAADRTLAVFSFFDLVSSTFLASFGSGE